MSVAAATAADRGRASVVSRGLTARAGLLDDGPLLIAGLAISGGIVAGMFLESGLLTTVSAFAAILASLFVPALGLVVLAFMGPLKPTLVIPAPGFNLILVAAILLGCVYQLAFSRTRLRAAPPLLLLSAFVLYAFVQQLPDMATGYASVQSHDVGYLFFQLLTGFGALVAAGFVLRNRSPYPFLVALLGSATFAAALAIVTADSVPLGGLANLMPPSDIDSRSTGPFGNPNSFGQLLAYASVLAAGWFASAHSLRLKSGLLIAVGIMGYAISLSLSRGAVATLFAGLVTLAFSRSRALGFVAAGVALAVAIVGYPVFLEWRLMIEAGAASSAAVAELGGSDESRFAAILAGPALLATSPVFGIGFGQYKYMSAMVTDQGAGLVAHNWYGTVLAEQGLLGIVLWLLMLVTVWMWLRSRPASPRTIGYAMLGAVIVGCLFLEPPTSFQTSVLPAVVLTGALVGGWAGRTRGTSLDGHRKPAGAGHRSAVLGRPVEAARGTGA